jgi:hypothetical protein
MQQRRYLYYLMANFQRVGGFFPVCLLILLFASQKAWAQTPVSLQFQRLSRLEGAPQGAALPGAYAKRQRTNGEPYIF